MGNLEYHVNMSKFDLNLRIYDTFSMVKRDVGWSRMRVSAANYFDSIYFDNGNVPIWRSYGDASPRLAY